MSDMFFMQRFVPGFISFIMLLIIIYYFYFKHKIKEHKNGS